MLHVIDSFSPERTTCCLVPQTLRMLFSRRARYILTLKQETESGNRTGFANIDIHIYLAHEYKSTLPQYY